MEKTRETKVRYKFFQHRRCEFFPCHKTPVWKFSCLFCYCPFFNTEECLNFNNCEECVYPHIKDNYESIICTLKGMYESRKSKEKKYKR
jgi:Zn-finger protein